MQLIVQEVYDTLPHEWVTPSAMAAGTAACSLTMRGSVQYSGTMRMEAAPSGRKRSSTTAVARYALQQSVCKP